MKYESVNELLRRLALEYSEKKHLSLQEVSEKKIIKSLDGRSEPLHREQRFLIPTLDISA